ncbi:sigma 54-interacting transcriptional regulator [Desulfogranum japonicum]|uniref:sigma 54-interacting transcriptional regulator n=1 Tax=Desulfogranum japonicum TaxID=231447 RepID=UPI001376E406
MTQQKTHALSNISVLLVDPDQIITGANACAENLSGKSADELIGKSIGEVFPPDPNSTSLVELLTKTTKGQAFTKQAVHLYSITRKQHISALLSIVPLPGIASHSGLTAITIDPSFQASTDQTIFDSVAEGVLTVNRNLEITSFNRAAEKLTGWEKNDVLGKKCNVIFPREICGEQCLIEESIAKECPISVQTVFMTNKNGHTFPLSLTSSPLHDPNGLIIGGVQTFHDCTDALHHDLLLSSLADGVFTIDREHHITSFNKAAERITGWTKDEVLGQPCHTIFHSSVCEGGCLLQKAIEHNNMYIDRAIFIKGKAGNVIPVTISSAPLLDDFGNITGGIETFRDNTTSIRESLILDSVADGVFTVDRNWKITSFNRAAEEITGWDREEAMGKSCSEIFQSSICGKNCAIAECLYTGDIAGNRSITIVNKGCEKVPISISAAPLTDHEGNIIGGVETFRDLSTITSLRKQLNQKYTFDEIISKATIMQRLFSILPDIARSPSTVLILGESGTGKELIARALYNASERRDKPFVVVNCGALPETLLESELFGYKAGAFTDARRDKLGRFAAAEGGTLFLDEIGDIPPSVQVKLLRVLQEKIYEPLGSNAPLKADVRIITATNRNLENLVQEGTFREDLFYRLNVVKINLPPLRERKEDIPLLVDHFIKKYSAQQGKDIVGIVNSALGQLMQYDYPGNIRELENIVEYAFILCEGGYIQPEHLPEPFSTGLTQQPKGRSTASSDGGQTLEEVEKQAIMIALERNKWRKMRTCEELNISKDTLRRKIKKYRLTNPLSE